LDGLIYRPNLNYYGSDELTVLVDDLGNTETDAQGNPTGTPLTDVAVVPIEVVLPPVARDDSADTPEDTPVDIHVTDNDYDSNGIIDPETVQIVAGSGPDHGTLEVNTGIVTYRPSPNYSGTDSFRYTVRNEKGFVSNEALVTITVEEVPDYHNALNPADVNHSGTVSPIDALIDINRLNGYGFELPPDPIAPDTPEYYYDVNGDGSLTASDILIIINELNRQSASGGEGEGASAAQAGPTALPAAGSLLAVPDYSLGSVPEALSAEAADPLQVTTLHRARSARRTPPALPQRAAAAALAFEAIGGDVLTDSSWDEVLGAIAEDIGGAGSDHRIEDLALNELGIGD